jgi:Pyridoxamine 5''-phosphate oxidase.
MEDRIERVRELLMDIHHVPIATVNEDGTPHNSPVFMAFDEELNGYWASHPFSVHSQNIAREGNVFIVVFDSREGHGGLFMEGTAHMLSDDQDIRESLELLQETKEGMYGTMGDISLYTGDSPQRIYRFKPTTAWVNESERNKDGVIIRDKRVEIPLSSLV